MRKHTHMRMEAKNIFPLHSIFKTQFAFYSVKEEAVDKHPEKRMKAAYEAFEKERLPQLKVEKSNMRLSQLKQIMKKEWMKHPDNPLNQRLAAMRAN